MKTYKKTINEPRLKIYYSDYDESPRNWTNLGYFITIDRDYTSPDDHPDFMEIIKETGEIAESVDNHIKLIKKEIEKRLSTKVVAIYPINKYEHGGVCYSLGYRQGFDYSNNGFYIITKESQKEMGAGEESFEAIIHDELRNYNKYINGETLAYALYDENGNVWDTLSGFYDIEDIRAELPKEWEKENLEDYFLN